MTENHLPAGMWEAVIKRILEAKEMILYDTFNPNLEPYIKRFELYVLYKDGWRNETRHMTEPQQFLYEHRYEVAHLYDMFVAWSNAQLEQWEWLYDTIMFNIQGP